MKNYTRIWLPLVVMIFVFCFKAQGQLNIGIRGGLNFAKLDPQLGAGYYKPTTGVNLALVLNKALDPVFSIQIEPGFSQRGGSYDFTHIWNFEGMEVRDESFGKISASYIELPVLLQYTPKLGKLVGILSFGYEVRLRTGPAKFDIVERQYQGGVLMFDNSEERSSSRANSDRAFDYGAIGGAGIAYPIGIVKVFAEGRYHLGLGNFFRDGENVYNRGASVHIGIMAPIRK